jgi:hypothetical protein
MSDEVRSSSIPAPVDTGSPNADSGEGPKSMDVVFSTEEAPDSEGRMLVTIPPPSSEPRRPNAGDRPTAVLGAGDFAAPAAELHAARDAAVRGVAGRAAELGASAVLTLRCRGIASALHSAALVVAFDAAAGVTVHARTGLAGPSRDLGGAAVAAPATNVDRASAVCPSFRATTAAQPAQRRGRRAARRSVAAQRRYVAEPHASARQLPQQ